MVPNATAMLQFWKDFGLTSFQHELDQTATDIAGRQDGSELSRKKLVEQMKIFKKSTSEDVRKAVGPLMKSFQLEIDSLTKRSNSCESEFLKVYKRLVELPDPSSCLEQAEIHQKRNQRLNDIEIENSKLRDTLAEYNKEFAEVKNQEVTIKSLREKIKGLEHDAEKQASKKIAEKEQQISKEFAAKEKVLLDNQLQAATKLSDAERKARSLEAALEASQSELFNLKVKFDEESVAKQAELDLIVSDLDRANQSAELAHKENETLRIEIESLENNQLNENKLKQSSIDASINEISQLNLEHELAAKEREVHQLVDDVQRLQASLLELRKSTAAQVSALEKEVESSQAHSAKLETLLQTRADYDDVKRELAIMKNTEFPADFNNDKPLEALLIEKNRVLQDENTTLRAAQVTLTEQCQQAREQLELAESGRDESAELVRKLEEDLMMVQAKPVVRSAADGSPNSQPISNQSHEQIANVLMDTASSAGGAGAEDSSDSMLVIVTSQRERFRLRNNELQAENYTLQQNIQQLHNELDHMRADNVKLYEKIKYLQNYTSSSSSSGGSTRVLIGEDVTAKRYSGQYEDQIDPFVTFNRKEKLRKYHNLSAPEKVTLGVSRMILASKVGRTVFFFYMLLMHFLLYVVLYKYAYVDDCKHHIADLCYKKFGAQMAPNN